MLYRDEEHERSVLLGVFDSHEEASKFISRFHGKDLYEINEVGSLPSKNDGKTGDLA